MSSTKMSYITSRLQRLSCMKEVEQAQAFITKSGLFAFSSIVSKIIYFTSLSPVGSLEHAQAIFRETTMDDLFICNTMIRAYSKSAFPAEALHVYNWMQRTNIEADNFTYNFVFKACARILWCNEGNLKFGGHWVSCKGCEIHSTVLKVGLDSDTHVQNSLVHLYSRCELVVNARRVFDEMRERDAASWNIMISVYDRIGDYVSSDYLFELMPKKNVVSWNTLLTRHVRLGDIKSARRVFEEMPEKDTVSWNTMISGYVHVKDYDVAIKLFGQMQNAYVEPSEITLISILGACAETGLMEPGRKIHESLKEKGYKIEGYLGVALVDMYAKCGNLGCAREVFDKLKMKPVSCWNAMIVGLAVHGFSEKALDLFESMETRLDEVRPDRVTFIGVLIACSHKGLVEKARKLFDCMIKEYNITPDMKHYGCMIDLLSRCGLLDEAHRTIESIPFKASPVLWRTLLGACRVYGNVELAQESFRQLSKVEPPTDGDYVLLSNVFAEAERWDAVERLRNEMTSMGIAKKSSSSHVEMQDSRMYIGA